MIVELLQIAQQPLRRVHATLAGLQTQLVHLRQTLYDAQTAVFVLETELNDVVSFLLELDGPLYVELLEPLGDSGDARLYVVVLNQ